MKNAPLIIGGLAVGFILYTLLDMACLYMVGASIHEIPGLLNFEEN